jgi:hypothetical protein
VNLTKDVTVRHLNWDLDEGDSPDLPWEYHDGNFRPTRTYVTVTDGALSLVEISGPALTKTGKLHVHNTGAWSWQWSSFGTRQWPPADCPEIAKRVAEAALGGVS